MSLPEDAVASPSGLIYKDDPFWSQNPEVLFRRDRLIEFVPTLDMTTNERLNAISRMFIYIGLLLLAYLGRSWALYIPVIGLAFALFLRKTRPEPEKPGRFVPNETPKTDDPNPFIPSKQPECIPSTLNNPFMNVLQNEYVDNPTRPPACDYAEVRGDVESNFNYNLYQDIDEALWNKNNSQRQFFTMPWTEIPNKQGEYARWLYKTGPTCKTDQSACLRYEDLRANRNVLGDSEYLM